MFWNMYSESDFLLCLFSTAPGIHACGLHNGETPLNRVEKQAHIFGSVDGNCFAGDDVVTAQPINVKLCFCDIQMMLDDVSKGAALLIV